MLRAVLTLAGTAGGPRRAAVLQDPLERRGRRARHDPRAVPDGQRVGARHRDRADGRHEPPRGGREQVRRGHEPGLDGGRAPSPARSRAPSYGPMQVQLTLTGQKITKVTVLQRTNDGSESDQIDAFAIPKLTSETLAAQSAQIDAVSGASYTSSGLHQVPAKRPGPGTRLTIFNSGGYRGRARSWRGSRRGGQAGIASA